MDASIFFFCIALDKLLSSIPSKSAIPFLAIMLFSRTSPSFSNNVFIASIWAFMSPRSCASRILLVKLLPSWSTNLCPLNNWYSNSLPILDSISNIWFPLLAIWSKVNPKLFAFSDANSIDPGIRPNCNCVSAPAAAISVTMSLNAPLIPVAFSIAAAAACVALNCVTAFLSFWEA